MLATLTELRFERPYLYPKQEAALFCAARFGYIEASTKSGKTVGALSWLLTQAFEGGKAGRNYWWIAPVYPQAEIAFRRCKFGLPAGTFKNNETNLTITLPNGAMLWFKSGEKPDNLYGEDVYAAVVDEASRVREEAWHALRSTLTATRGPVRFIGNVKGRKNWFYRDARKAEAGEASTHYAKITAYDAVQAGIITRAEVEQAKAQLPENVFRELYEAEPSDDGGNPFGLSAIQACIAPLSQAAPVAWGWDLAKSVDWTVGMAADRDGRVCQFRRFQKPWEETFDTILGATGNTYALVDSTGVGDPIVERLQKRLRGVEGYLYTQRSKQQLMEGLALAIQQRKVSFPSGPGYEAIVNELESFEYVFTKFGVQYSAPVGAHDDCVNALALMVKAMEPRVGKYSGIVKYPRTA